MLRVDVLCWELAMVHTVVDGVASWVVVSSEPNRARLKWSDANCWC